MSTLVILTPSYSCMMNCLALDWSPVNIIGGFPTNLSPWCPPGCCGAGMEIGGPLPGGPPPTGGPPLNGPPPGPCASGPPLGHPNGIVGGVCCLANSGGSGQSGPMALYNMVSSVLMGSFICPVIGLITPVGASIIIV
jgi:hypothetical protein